MIKVGLGLILENEIRKFKGKNRFGYEFHGSEPQSRTNHRFIFP